MIASEVQKVQDTLAAEVKTVRDATERTVQEAQGKFLQVDDVIKKAGEDVEAANINTETVLIAHDNRVRELDTKAAEVEKVLESLKQTQFMARIDELERKVMELSKQGGGTSENKNKGGYKKSILEF